jgi:hypothetical protein
MDGFVVELLITGRYNLRVSTLEELRAYVDGAMVEGALLLGPDGPYIADHSYLERVQLGTLGDRSTFLERAPSIEAKSNQPGHSQQFASFIGKGFLPIKR